MKIVQYPHPALRHAAKPVTFIDLGLRRLAGRMLELMYESKGLGLAAPQVAVPLQLLVMNFDGDPEKKDLECVAVNPVLVEKKGSQEGDEGCLSFPGLYQKVRRAKSVKVQAYNLQGELFEMEASELPSRLWQHEIDHLHGELFIDKMSAIGKLSSRSTLKEFEADYRKAQRRGEIALDPELVKRLLEFREPLPPDGPLL